MIVAEELALLALEPQGDGARGGVAHGPIGLAITGGLIVDLERDGHLVLDEQFHLHLTGTRPVHPVLAAEIEHLAPLEGRRLGAALLGVPHAGWDEALDHLVATGVVRRDKPALRRARFPLTEPAIREDLLTEVRAAAFGREPLDDRMAALLALAGPGKLIGVISPHWARWPGVRRRMREATRLVPVAELIGYATQTSFWASAGDGMVGP